MLEVHGANLETQSGEFRDKIKELADPLIKEGVVQWVGPYQPHEIASRMANIDWVVVPSVWWENSPMVIQEAFVYGRPLLVSNIGGMAEKVVDGVNGLHIPANNPDAWARSLLQASCVEQWAACHQGISSPASHVDCSKFHVEVLRIGRPEMDIPVLR